MSLDQQKVTGPSPGHRVSLESVLGSTTGRYFGAGYRDVGYALTDVVLDAGTLAGVGQVTYPRTWSTDASGQARSPHLSSIDATLLPLVLLEGLATPDLKETLTRSRITELHLVAGSTPFLALDSVPIHGTVEETADGMQFRAVVGNIKVTLTFAAAPSHIDLRSGSLAGCAPSVYSGLFRHVEGTSWIRPNEQDLTRLTGEHVLQLDSSADVSAPFRGLEALQWPAPTMVDYLVIMGQLTQALVYTAAGRKRSNSGPLWMRTININLDGSVHPLPARFTTSIELLRDRTIQRKGTTVHDCKVQSFASTGVSAVATLAYQEG